MKQLMLLTVMPLTMPSFSAGAAGAAERLALTPPMGWNSWNKFGCDVSEQLVRETADAMVSSGMKAAGYEYVVIDDCWQVERGADGRIVADPKRFPSGMKALADYVHSKGLKFGLYSDAGTQTCGKRPGSKGYEEKDAQTYASWGVDYLKYDWCFTEGMDQRDAYGRMSRHLRATGRDILFSMCEWGSSKPWLWAQGTGHMWRSTGDIQDCWDCSTSWGGMGVTHIVDLNAELYPYAGPGHWNDPDMLEVGNGGLSPAETRAHFSLWALFAAPLIAGNDLRSMTPAVRDVLTQPEVIAVNQDPLGVQGRRVRDEGAKEVWSKPLADGSRAVILFNRGNQAGDIYVDWEDAGLPAGPALVRDLWKRADLGTFTRRFETKVEPHDVVMLRVTPISAIASSFPVWPTGCARFEGAERVACLESIAFDFGTLRRYAGDDTALAPAPGRVVFFGDSITDNWDAPGYGGFFPGKPYVNRGIGGQTTAQMLVRYRPDVLALKPAAVVILAGTNDIAGNAGPTTVEAIQDNLATMAELARFHGASVVLASILPVRDDKIGPDGKPRVWTDKRPADTIARLNRWLAEYARANGHGYLDYFAAVATPEGALRSDLTDDGLHPNAAGYAVMGPLVEAAIAQAVTKR